MGRVARAGSSASASTAPAASHSEIPRLSAASAISSTVRSPIPRAGTLITRRSAMGSWGLRTRRRYATTSLISLRS